MGGSKHRMRPAEPASVVGVDYVIAADRETWMRLRLALADDSSPLAGREFMVDLPPPQTDYGDFVILRSRWDAAMQQCWRVNDRCQVCCGPPSACYSKPFSFSSSCAPIWYSHLTPILKHRPGNRARPKKNDTHTGNQCKVALQQFWYGQSPASEVGKFTLGNC